MLVDLRPKGAKGRDTEKALDRAAITTNKNAVPFDTEKAGDHLRHPPRHARRHDTRLRHGGIPRDRKTDRRDRRRGRQERRGGDVAVEASVAARVHDLCHRFPIYP
ncbi:MAG: hypothetical protein WDM86_18660 [Rhizomicrobium sp.]